MRSKNKVYGIGAALFVYVAFMIFSVAYTIYFLAYNLTDSNCLLLSVAMFVISTVLLVYAYNTGRWYIKKMKLLCPKKILPRMWLYFYTGMILIGAKKK